VSIGPAAPRNTSLIEVHDYVLVQQPEELLMVVEGIEVLLGGFVELPVGAGAAPWSLSDRHDQGGLEAHGLGASPLDVALPVVEPPVRGVEPAMPAE
jgi:hypothetical protein